MVPMSKVIVWPEKTDPELALTAVPEIVVTPDAKTLQVIFEFKGMLELISPYKDKFIVCPTGNVALIWK